MRGNQRRYKPEPHEEKKVETMNNRIEGYEIENKSKSSRKVSGLGTKRKTYNSNKLLRKIAQNRPRVLFYPSSYIGHPGLFDMDYDVFVLVDVYPYYPHHEFYHNYNIRDKWEKSNARRKRREISAELKKLS